MAAASDPSPLLPPKPISILLIEDNPGDVRLILEQLHTLPDEFYDLQRVDRLEPALASLRTAEVDMVLLDLGLPDSSGLETFRRLHHDSPNQPILVISGLDDEALAIAAVQEGAQDYLVKGRLEGAVLTRAIRYAIARKRAETGHAASEAYYRTILEHVADAVFVSNRDGSILDVNPAALGLMGYGREEALQLSLLDTCVPEERTTVERRMGGGDRRASIGTERQDAFERRLVRKDGRIIVVEGSQIDLPDGRILSTVRDVTERRRYEEQLRESERRFRELADSVREAFFVIDPNSRLAQYVNPAYERIFGHSRAFAAATPDAWTEHVHPEDRERVLAIQEAGLQNGDFGDMTFRLQKEPGVVCWIRSRTASVRDGMGRVARLVGIAEDITELKRAEEQSFEAQKMEAVGRLAGGVAHDFNNVLTAILGYVELLDGSLIAGDERHRDVCEIRTAAERAAGLTRQLLTFSRHQVVELVVLSPNDVLSNLDRMLHRMIGEDITLTLVLGVDTGNVRGDVVQLEQVAMNLVVNARDAMPAGGTITITTTNAEYRTPFAESHLPVPPGRYVLLTVADTGEGMSDETISRIFEPFFTTKEKGRGTGLGLSTVYGIVRQSEGFIGVSSTLAAGTAFRVYLPRVDAAVEPEPAITQLPQVMSGNETILLAEDDPQLRRLCASLLLRLGYKVLETASAEDALMVASDERQHIDLVLTDVIMPGESGPLLVNRLFEARPELRVLYMSGYTGDAIVRLGLLRPGLNYLQKPFTPNDLAQRVRQVLDAANAQAEQ